MNSFITGSEAYGKPRADSDIDLVILCSEFTKALLIKHSDLGNEPVRYNNLNLIVCTDDAEFAVWKVGTASCCNRKQKTGISLSSEKAASVLDDLFISIGMDRRQQSGE